VGDKTMCYFTKNEEFSTSNIFIEFLVWSTHIFNCL